MRNIGLASYLRIARNSAAKRVTPSRQESSTVCDPSAITADQRKPVVSGIGGREVGVITLLNFGLLFLSQWTAIINRFLDAEQLQVTTPKLPSAGHWSALNFGELALAKRPLDSFLLAEPEPRPDFTHTPRRAVSSPPRLRTSGVGFCAVTHLPCSLETQTFAPIHSTM